MEVEVLPPIPEEDGTYCTNKRYPWVAFCPDADYMEWDMVVSPPGVTINDIQQTTPNGRINFITVPVAGSYCFIARCCMIQ